MPRCLPLLSLGLANSLLKGGVVGGDRLSEGEELREQVFGSGKADLEGAWLEGDVRGEGRDVGGGGYGDAFVTGVLIGSEALEVLADAVVAGLLDADAVGGFEGLEFGDEVGAFDEEAFAGGVATQGREDAEGLAGAEMEEGLEGAAVNGGVGKGAEFGEGGGNALNPLGVAGHGGRIPHQYCIGAITPKLIW